MAEHAAASHDDHAPDVKLYIGVFAALMALTVITVWISKFHLQVHEAVALGMLVAGVKASLVAAVFMHLWGEKKLIFWALGITAFFAAFLVLDVIDGRLVASRRLDPVDVKLQQPAAHGEEHPAPSMEPAAEPAAKKKAAH